MGKRGPCSHCGVKCTPLWRNGPSEKPVLCNACGSRYRIRGTLANYTPKNVHYIHRRRPTNVNHPDNAAPTDNNLIIQDDETDYSASSEDRGDIQSTTIESSISCEKNIFKTEDVEENEPRIYPPAAPFFGNFQPNISESHIPSRKRSEVVYSSSSLLEDLQRDLSKMLKYEEFYHLTESAMEEQVLIYNVDNPISSGDEIGLGGILLKPPTTSTEEGSSEAMEDKVPNLKPATRKSSSL